MYPFTASGSSVRPLSVAEPRRITRLNALAGDGVAHLLLSRLTLCLRFNALFTGGLCTSARWGSVDLRLRQCANRKCEFDRNDECRPHFNSPVLLRLGRSLDGKPVR